MRKTLFSILCLIVSLCCEVSASDWVSHFSYEKPVLQLERIDNMVYAVSDGKLFSYNTSTSEYSTPLKERQNTPITKIACDEKNKKLLIVRENYEIDVFDGTNFTGISVLRESNLKISKTINDISIFDGVAYVSTDLGLIVIDMLKAEVQNFCMFLFPFYSTAVLDGNLYAATSKGVYRISPEKDLRNFDGWESFPLDEKYAANDETAFKDEDIRSLGIYNNQLYILVPKNSLFHLNGNVVERNAELSMTPTSLEIKGDRMYVHDDTKLSIYTKGSPVPSTLDIEWVTCIVDDVNEDEYWLGLIWANLTKFKHTGSSISFSNYSMKPPGPLTNYPFEMNYAGGKIRLVGGGYYYDVFRTLPQLSELDKDGWFNYGSPASGARDYTSFDVNPADPTNVLVSTWGLGIYEFKDKAFVKLHNQANSSLTDIFGGSGYVRLDGLKFEGPDKFWVCNTMVPTVINLFQKEGGVWKSYKFNHPEIYIPHNANQGIAVCELMVDSRGNKWIGTMFASYIFIFNENGTPANLNDDKTKHITKFYDQNGEAISLGNIGRIKEDKKGNIWIAAGGGLYMIEGDVDVFNEDITFNRIEFTGNTGSVANKYLFEKLNTNDIAFDAANRKWIATEDNGVFLMDERGQEVLANFTIDNSPIPSNRVFSVAIDEKGSVFIGTDKGVVAFSGSLATNLPTQTNPVYVYPNPITSDFSRNMMVKGLKANSLVRIIDAENNEINTGFASNEGSFEWNGVDIKGGKVVPAAYYLLGTDQDGVEGILSTLRVIN